MLNNLQHIPTWLWILAIVATITISVVIIWIWRRRFHITAFEVTAGPLKAKLEPRHLPGAAEDSPMQAASVNISDNKLFGKTKLDVRREGTNISGNLAAGKTEIAVGAKPGPKPRVKRGKQPK